MSNSNHSDSFEDFAKYISEIHESFMTPELQESIWKVCELSANFSRDVLGSTQIAYSTTGFTKTFESINVITSQISQIMEPLFPVLNEFSKSISPKVSEIYSTCTAILNNIGNSPDAENYDYVEIDECIANEIELPESIRIPVGNKKIKVRTDLFITIVLSIVCAIAPMLYSINQDAKDSRTNAYYEEKRIDAINEQSFLLKEILESVNASNSTQEESISTLKEYAQFQELVYQESEKDPDSTPLSNDNNPE